MRVLANFRGVRRRRECRNFYTMRRAGMILLLLGMVIAEEEGPMVRTELGLIRGKWMATQRKQRIAGFLGIPYAEAPVGALRFKSPVPWTESWEGIRNATEDGSMCVQQTPTVELIGDEDCLYINVFTPQVSENRSYEEKLPIMVFVHGGAYTIGSSNSSFFGPEYLLDQNIILVTLNYRLGFFGFFSTGTSAAPGNYGLKDIVAALQWVQKNAEAFGGNPESVTLVGFSSGAAAAHLLTFPKTTEGLFHRYVTHSGAGQAAWSYRNRKVIRDASLQLARRANCTTLDHEDDPEDAVKCLRGLDIDQIATSLNVPELNDSGSLASWRYPFSAYGPTDEPESDDAILTEHPTKLMREGKIRDVPWITGLTTDEGLELTVHHSYMENGRNLSDEMEVAIDPLILNATLREEMERDFEKTLPYFISYQDSITNASIFVEALSSFYFHNSTVVGDFTNYYLTKLVGDALSAWPVHEVLKYQADAMKSNVYVYLFAYQGTFSETFKFGTPEHYGVSHSDDMNYLFPVLNNRHADLQLNNTEDDITMINIMTEMWANFAKTGVPSARLTKEWEPYQKSHGFMKFGEGKSSNISMGDNYITERMKFWEELMNNVSIPIPEVVEDADPTDAGGAQTIFVTCGVLIVSVVVVFNVM